MKYLGHLRLMIVKIFDIILCLRETFYSSRDEISILELQKRIQNPVKHLQLCYAKIDNGLQPSIFFKKSFTLDV